MVGIPPNWKVLRKAKNPYEPIQAVCEGAKGKIQYIYHPLWDVIRNFLKFHKMIKMCLKVKTFTNDNSLLGNTLSLMLHTCIRTGSSDNRTSLGLTTLTKKNIFIDKNKLYLKFIGKSGVSHCIKITDPKLIKFIYSRNKAVRGNQPLLGVSAASLNAYIKKEWGSTFTCKDIRTCKANLEFIEILINSREVPKKALKEASEKSAELLGHTVAVSKKNYIFSELAGFYLEDPDKFKRARNSAKLLKSILNHQYSSAT